MILYHGSNMVVSSPKLVGSGHSLDFGPGFYTTTNYDQAADFAKKVVDRNDSGLPIVNSYHIDDSIAYIGLSVRKFNGPTDDWLDFVVDNRRNEYVGPKYDLKIGPVANDNVYRTIQLYMAGVLTREATVLALKVRDLFNQYVFSSEVAIARLRFIKSEVVQ